MIVQICVAIYLVIIIPIIESIAYLNYVKQIKAGTFSKQKFYLSSIFELWLPVIVLFILVIFGNISIINLGLSKVIFNYHNTQQILLSALIIIALIPVLFLVFSTYQIFNIYTNSNFKKAYYEAVAQKIKRDDSLNIKLAILPKNKKERLLWICVSITAGITEEILFRGFIVYFLQILFPELPLWILMLIQTIPFCLMHIYQGINGIVTSAIAGIFLAVYTYLFGSIIVAIIIHILIDLSSILIEREQTHAIMVKEDD